MTTDEAPSPSPFPLSARWAYACGVASGLLYWLAFPGQLQIGGWHGLLSLVAFIPMWLGVQGQTPKRAMWVGVLAGATMNLAGFTWLLEMLKVFSGFPLPLCLLFMALVCTYQGGRIGLMGWLYGRSTQRGWPAATVFVAAFAVSELVYPLLFPWYYAATTYKLPALSQTAELGGPILVGSILVGTNIALAEPLLAHLERRTVLRGRLVAPLATLALALVFALVRIPQVDAGAQAAPPVHVGVVQGNLDLLQKREEPAEGLRRHLRLSNELKDKGVDFVVWSESSVTMPFPERTYGPMMRDQFGRYIGVPAVIGAVLFSESGLQQALYNTALSLDAHGLSKGRYDKEFLLAFGEYLPFGEMFPKLYEWSPNSGHFTPGTLVDPLPVTIQGITHSVSALICYEDILPSFTNKAVSFAKPELLVNMSNDAWFGDSSEPWEHLALAQLRAVEHRRYLVRSTNSGVSAIIDPVGRVMVHGRTFDAEALDAIVHWLTPHTVYEMVGDTPWVLLSVILFLSAFVRKRVSPVLATAMLVGCGSSGAVSPTKDAGHGIADAQFVTTGDTGSTSPPQVDAGPCPASAGIGMGTASCSMCVALECCPSATACDALTDAGDEPACALYGNCISGCEGAYGDAGSVDAQGTCVASQCNAVYASAAKALYAKLETCIAVRCTNEAGTAPCNP